ncbi:PAAR repeat-containing protein [Cupriavidus necator]|uniref:PAAR repeat-containing protein n=1 Tax=Cupriavidus necator TaxID=106590 RepID=A0A1K0J8Q7_CUPNE|nr:PAAR repeat-containing protein [Cupriavidus necator]
MTKSLIVVGDVNSSNGPVITGSSADTIDGRPIARMGDLVACPARYPDGRPHGTNPIVEGDTSMMVGGKPVALHGHRCQCGCTLIGSVTAHVGD